MISAKDRLIQLKSFHRACYTLQCLVNIYPQSDHLCMRCATSRGTFLHMMWSCPMIRPYWKWVVDTLNDMCDLTLRQNPFLLLLSHMEDVEVDRYIKFFLT